MKALRNKGLLRHPCAKSFATSICRLFLDANRNLKLLLVFGLAFVLGCNWQSQGFVLPEGDVAKGKKDFVAFSCDQCHSIGDISWEGKEGDVEVKLGGEVSTLKTYGELVTSVIHPSHKIASGYLEEKVAPEGRSKMENYHYNQVMTIQELIDVVTFLQSEYEILTPTRPYTYH